LCGKSRWVGPFETATQSPQPRIAGISSPPLVTGPFLANDLSLVEVASQDIRPPRVEGDRELVVHRELDGELEKFGVRFWEIVSREHRAPAALLADASKQVSAIEYSDRYLFTPASMAILLRIIAGLRDQVGPVRWADPQVSIATTAAHGGGENRAMGTVYADWPDLRTRDAVAVEAFSSVSQRVNWRVADKFGVQHGRSLVVTFSGGKTLRVRLDQGVTYWRVPSPANSRQRFSSRFDFQTPDVKAQAKAVVGMDVPVEEGGAMPTELFIKVRDKI
jgi:DEAD/DEAH box helicase domain-containing protein